jgi:hypothetical protein
VCVIMSDPGDDMEDFSMDKWMYELGISDGGKKKLETAEIRDEQSIILLDEITLLTVKLALGDFVKFRRGQVDLRLKLDKPPKLAKDSGLPAKGLEKGDKPEGATPLYSMEQFAAFLAGRPMDAASGSGVTTTSISQPRVDAQVHFLFMVLCQGDLLLLFRPRRMVMGMVGRLRHSVMDMVGRFSNLLRRLVCHRWI